MDYKTPEGTASEAGHSDVGELIRRIGDDLQSIARDEVALARIELTKTIKVAAAEMAAIFLGGLVALIGLGMLCVAVVPALAPVIPALWLRLLIVALVYMLIGGAVAASFAKRLKRDARPDFHRSKQEAQRTVESVRRELRHG